MFATSISLLLTIVTVAAAVSSALLTYRSWSLASRIRSHASLQAEIAEIDACVHSLIKTIRRIEGRQTSTMHRDTIRPAQTELMDKDQLRRYLADGKALIPGRPARHGNDNPP